ncbi:TetR/AcrR family transcriptional regulator [Tumebacillus lipolyticus]|uniref:TetR/AcrR family transcriptional regulator n=1 Tax=Tumebacillus lipolyticus TaxID=1280370 RepID=A0ABW4ZVH6_9BACL
MPSNRKELRAEETKRAILSASRQLFTERGFDAVTMREIAKAAGCSHTTIYIYFKDKEALLHQLAMSPLQTLQQQIESELIDETTSPDRRLQRIAHLFLTFCFTNRNLYKILFLTKATRVDLEEPELEVQKLRNQLFALLQRSVQATLPPAQNADQALAYTRILFYMLHGIISTYLHSDEPYDMLIARLAPTFELAVEVVLTGIKQTVEQGVEEK